MHEKSPLPETPVGEDRFRKGQRVTWISIAVNVVLTAMQVVVGIVAHSQSLIADALHTLSDIVSDGFVLYANHKGSEDPDEEHPYGHGRFETAASLVLGLLLAATGVGILVSAASRLENLDTATPVGVAAIWAALITLAGKEGLFRYMLGIAQRLRSPMLVANAWHARADALSSLVVAVGVAGALAGFNFADAAAAIIVGAMIIKTGFGFAWTALRELIDTGLSEEEVARIRGTILNTAGVLGLHELRTRRMGHQALVDAHILVNSRISVSEGHMIGETARARVLSDHPEVLDVLVHVDDEDDHDMKMRKIELPERAVLLQHLRTLLGEELPDFDRTVLHYLSSGLEAEVFLPSEIAMDPAHVARMERHLAERLPENPWFSSVSLNCRVAPN